LNSGIIRSKKAVPDAPELAGTMKKIPRKARIQNEGNTSIRINISVYTKLPFAGDFCSQFITVFLNFHHTTLESTPPIYKRCRDRANWTVAVVSSWRKFLAK
jgi:hypothetical protein